LGFYCTHGAALVAVNTSVSVGVPRHWLTCDCISPCTLDPFASRSMAPTRSCFGSWSALILRRKRTACKCVSSRSGEPGHLLARSGRSSTLRVIWCDALGDRTRREASSIERGECDSEGSGPWRRHTLGGLRRSRPKTIDNAACPGPISGGAFPAPQWREAGRSWSRGAEPRFQDLPRSERQRGIARRSAPVGRQCTGFASRWQSARGSRKLTARNDLRRSHPR